MALAYLAGAFVLVVWWMVNGTGLFGFFDRLFTRHQSGYDVHSPGISFFASLLATLVPGVVARVVLGHRVRHHDPEVPNVMKF